MASKSLQLSSRHYGLEDSLNTSSLSIKDNTEAASVWVLAPSSLRQWGRELREKKEVLPFRSFVCLPGLYLFQVLGRILYRSPNTGKSLHFLGNVASMFLMNLIVAKSDFGEDSGSDFFFSF